MAFRYRKTKEEEKAERILRDRGWTVSEPQCPECHGMGSVGQTRPFQGDIDSRTFVYSTVPCPNKCPQPMMFY